MLYAASCQFVKFVAEFVEMANLELGDLVGARLREQRKRAGLSVEQLSERCAAHGLPLSSTAIYLIEGGGRGKAGSRSRRRITIDEWLTLAHSLGVSPLVLLLPKSDSEYPITPDLVSTAEAAYMWLIGERLPPLPEPGEDPGQTNEQRVVAFAEFVKQVSYAGNRELLLPEQGARIEGAFDELQERIKEQDRRLDELEKLRQRVEGGK